MIITDRLLHNGVRLATAPGRGIKYRVDSHLDQSYYNTERSKGDCSVHYDIVDQQDRDRVECFYKLVEAQFLLHESMHIDEARFAFVVLQQVFRCWTRSLVSQTTSPLPKLVPPRQSVNAAASPDIRARYQPTGALCSMMQSRCSRGDRASRFGS